MNSKWKKGELKEYSDFSIFKFWPGKLKKAILKKIVNFGMYLKIILKKTEKIVFEKFWSGKNKRLIKWFDILKKLNKLVLKGN